MPKRPVIPPKLRIAGCDWAVVKGRLEAAYGMSLDTTKTITLDPEACANGFMEADTLLHETMHSVLRQQGRLYVPEEEVYVNALATGLIGVLRDNPSLLKYLTKALS